MVPFSASALTSTPFAVIVPIASAAASDTEMCIRDRYDVLVLKEQPFKISGNTSNAGRVAGTLSFP